MQTLKRLGAESCALSVLITPAKQEDFGVAFGDAFAGHSEVGGFSIDDCDEIFYPCLKRFIEACRSGCVWNCRFEQLHFSPTTATCRGHAFVMEHRWGPQQVSMMSPCPSNVKGFYITVVYCPRSPTKWAVTGSDVDDDDDDDDDECSSLIIWNILQQTSIQTCRKRRHKMDHDAISIAIYIVISGYGLKLYCLCCTASKLNYDITGIMSGQFSLLILFCYSKIHGIMRLIASTLGRLSYHDSYYINKLESVAVASK